MVCRNRERDKRVLLVLYTQLSTGPSCLLALKHPHVAGGGPCLLWFLMHRLIQLLNVPAGCPLTAVPLQVCSAASSYTGSKGGGELSAWQKEFSARPGGAGSISDPSGLTTMPLSHTLRFAVTRYTHCPSFQLHVSWNMTFPHEMFWRSSQKAVW